MQAYRDHDLIAARVGALADLLREAGELPAADQIVIGAVPRVGDEVTLHGLVWVVERVQPQHGWMRLRLLKPESRNQP